MPLNKKGKFNLQKLLDVRELVEKERQKELSLSKQKLKAEEEILSQLEAKQDRAAQRAQELDRGKVNSFQDHHSYLTSLHASIVNKRQEIANIEQEVEGKRLELLEAAKDRKALDKLKEKHAIQQREIEKQTEQAYLDEIAINKSQYRNRAHK